MSSFQESCYYARYYLLIVESSKNCYNFIYMNRIACQYLLIVLLLWNYLLFKPQILLLVEILYSAKLFVFINENQFVVLLMVGKLDLIHIRKKLMLKFYNSLVKRQDTVGSICVKLYQMDNHFVHMYNQLGIDIHSTLLVSKVLYASLSEVHKHFNDTCCQ